VEFWLLFFWVFLCHLWELRNEPFIWAATPFTLIAIFGVMTYLYYLGHDVVETMLTAILVMLLNRAVE